MLHLDKLLVQLSDGLQLLVLHDSGLLQDLLLLPEQILQTERKSLHRRWPFIAITGEAPEAVGVQYVRLKQLK